MFWYFLQARLTARRPKSGRSERNPRKLIDIGIEPDSLPLPGLVVYQKTPSGTYAVYRYAAFKQDNNTYPRTLYLGKTIDRERGIYKNKNYGGLFVFSAAKGCGKPPPKAKLEVAGFPKLIVLTFGDVWMIDQIFKESGLDKVLEDTMPEYGDNLKALVCFRLIRDKDYSYAENWHRKSYARILYPNARLAPTQIREFHAILGHVENYQTFHSSYLTAVTKN